MTADKPYTSIREVEAAHRAKLDDLRAQLDELIKNEERIAAELRAELAALKGGQP